MALLIALIRTVEVPALFPVRMLAVVYVDVMRGIPAIMLVYLVGFGVPALQLNGLPTSAVVLGEIALAMCYSAYVSEVLPRRYPLGPPKPGGGRARARPDAPRRPCARRSFRRPSGA